MLMEATGGLAARPEGFVIYLSTQSDTPPCGVFADKLAEWRDIRDGKIQAPHVLPLLYEFPNALLKDERFRAPEHWRLTNPNLGASVSQDYLETQYAEAQRSGRAKLNIFFAKHLNVQIGQALRADGWVGAEVWEIGREDGLTLETLLDRSEVVTIGVDGGGLMDLYSVAVIGRDKETGHWLCWSHSHLTAVGAFRCKANAEDYLAFKRAGELTVFRQQHVLAAQAESDPAVAALLEDVEAADPTPGALGPDIAYTLDLVKRIKDRGLLGKVGVDAAMIGALVDALATIGVTQEAGLLEAVRQGVGLRGAIKTVERKLDDGTFRHGGQKLLDWSVGNLVVVLTPSAMRVARDEAGFGKVDPMMAVFDAAELMSRNPEAKNGPSIYEKRGLTVLRLGGEALPGAAAPRSDPPPGAYEPRPHFR